MTEHITWTCDCGETFTTEPERHRMVYCPGCGDEYVDHEEHYMRHTFGVEQRDE